MKKTIVQNLVWLACLLGCILLLIPASLVQAADTDNNYSIHIIKYRLPEGTSFDSNLQIDGSKIESVQDEKGNKLETLAGVSYTVQRLQLKEGATDETTISSFELATGDNAFEEIQTTNAQGEANFLNLAQGFYKVTENPSSQIAQVMEPVLVSLPLYTREETLNDVYLYPKSNIISNTTPVSDISRIPQTSGNIGQANQIFVLMGIVIIMGAVGLIYSFKKKGQHSK